MNPWLSQPPIHPYEEAMFAIEALPEFAQERIEVDPSGCWVWRGARIYPRRPRD